MAGLPRLIPARVHCVQSEICTSQMKQSRHPIVNGAAALALLFTGAGAQAQNWVGPNGGSWFDINNWDSQSVPDALTSVYMFGDHLAVIGAPGAVADTVNIGDVSSGAGTIRVQGGGTMVSQALNIGGFGIGDEFGVGSLIVTGTGSSWSSNGGIAIQGPGSQITVSAGGHFVTTPDSGGTYFDRSGTITVTGLGSSWSNTGVVSFYTGTANFQDGAIITSATVFNGVADDNLAVFNVGTGAQWTASNMNFTGPASTILNISGGASVTLTSTSQNALRAGNHGRINIGTGGLAGSLSATRVVFPSTAGGILDFNHTDDITFSVPIVGNGQVIQEGPGATTLSGISTYTGSTSVEEGTLHVVGAIASSPVTIKLGARLSGNGLVGPLTLESGGTLAPGVTLVAPGGSTAVLTIGTGSILNGTLALEIGGVTRGAQYDAFTVADTGVLTLGGTLNVTFINSFLPAPGDTFQLFAAPSLSGSFAQVNLPPLPGGSTWDTSQLGSTGTLAVAAVPEPGSAMLLLAGLGMAARRRSARR